MAKEDPDALLLAHVGQKVLIKKDGKVLMCKGRDFDTLWDFPGGRIHKNEKPAQALVREVKEELGVDIEVGKPLYTCASNISKSNIPRYYIVFEGKIKNPDARFTLASDEIKEVRWVGESEVDSLETWDDWKVVLNTYL